MERLRYCARGGLLVGRDPIGPTSHDFDWRPSNTAIGCNHLHCTHCNNPVAHHLAAARTYSCGCTELVVTTPLRVNDPEEGPLAWVCAGHSPLPLPAVLDGIALDADSLAPVANLIVTGQLFGTPELAGFWLARLHALLPDPPTGLPSPDRLVLESALTSAFAVDPWADDFASLSAWSFARHRPSTQVAATAVTHVEHALRLGQPIPPRAEQAVFERADAGHGEAREVLWALALLGVASAESLTFIHTVMPSRIHGAPAHVVGRLRPRSVDA